MTFSFECLKSMLKKFIVNCSSYFFYEVERRMICIGAICNYHFGNIFHFAFRCVFENVVASALLCTHVGVFSVMYQLVLSIVAKLRRTLASSRILASLAHDAVDA